LRRSGEATLVSPGTRAEYKRDGISEWYANSPGGLEQGFSLARRHGTARKGEPLVISKRCRIKEMR